MIDDPKVGNLVYLNSGSPPLTITAVLKKGTTPTGEVEVSWLDNNSRPQSATFPVVCLKELPDETV